jgi:hypothetical protein
MQSFKSSDMTLNALIRARKNGPLSFQVMGILHDRCTSEPYAGLVAQNSLNVPRGSFCALLSLSQTMVVRDLRS